MYVFNTQTSLFVVYNKIITLALNNHSEPGTKYGMIWLKEFNNCGIALGFSCEVIFEIRENLFELNHYVFGQLALSFKIQNKHKLLWIVVQMHLQIRWFLIILDHRLLWIQLMLYTLLFRFSERKKSFQGFVSLI